MAICQTLLLSNNLLQLQEKCQELTEQQKGSSHLPPASTVQA